MILIKNLISLLRQRDIVYIQPHNFPDADAIASAFGLQYFLSTFDIKSIIIYAGVLDKLTTERLCSHLHIEAFNFKEHSNMTEDDYIINIDSQRYNSNVIDLIGNKVACIDHHTTFRKYKYRYKDIRTVGACASIIASYYIDTNIQIPKDVATALLYGIQTDTANFTRGVKNLDIEMFSNLYNIADTDYISQLMKTSLTLSDLTAFGTAIKNVVISNGIGFADIPFDCNDTLIAKIADFILSLDCVDFAVAYAIRKDGIKLSVRSKIPKVLDAGKITNSTLQDIGSGGGHSFMAGGFVPTDCIKSLNLEDIKSSIIDRFSNSVETQLL